MLTIVLLVQTVGALTAHIKDLATKQIIQKHIFSNQVLYAPVSSK